jgi:hypothetical protein
MNTEQARELLKENFEELRVGEFLNKNTIEYLLVNCSDGTLYFKPKEKFPKVFEDLIKEILIWSIQWAEWVTEDEIIEYWQIGKNGADEIKTKLLQELRVMK